VTTDHEVQHIVLVGLMGTGKTTVGAILAEQLDRRLVDSDALVEAREGRTVRDIWKTDGEAAYRVMETAALREGLTGDDPMVVAAAGGVVLSADNRAMLREVDACVVWLQVPVDVLVARVRTQTHRPLLDDDPSGTLTRMAADRAPLYAEVADHMVDATADPQSVAAEIRALCRC
jgi:shikimate kinase